MNTKIERWDEEFDVIVLGAGGAGLTAAVVAATDGMRVLLIEKSDQVGGTTALSSGTVWIPNSPQQQRDGTIDDAKAAREYLNALVGSRADPAMREAFIEAGPEMLEYLERHTEVRFQMYRQAPDYRQDMPGAAEGRRALEPLPFDGRKLGAHFSRLRWPIPEFMLFGGMMVTRGEAVSLMRGVKSVDSIVLALKLVGRYLLDRLSYRRGTRLVLGNALIARLYKSVLDRRANIWFEATTTHLIMEGERVSGAVVERGGVEQRVRARCAIILAGGGFAASPELRERYLPKPVAQYTAAWKDCAGDTLQLAQNAGAAMGDRGEYNAFWFPSSVARRKDGSTAVYPHIVLDRPKPGIIAVNSAGRRFVNEAVSYHEFTRAMYQSHKIVPSIPAMLVCDSRFLWKYGMGMVRPLTPRFLLKPFIDSGYLQIADTIKDLAGKINVDAAGLTETVKANNGFARAGVDAQFGKGGDIYNRAGGDPERGQNPCLGPIQTPPYFAVAVVPTPLATSLGLRTNPDGQVLNAAGRPIVGLYACGNDMDSIWGGEYPGAGAQIGPAMTFGYLAARHAARSYQAGGVHNESSVKGSVVHCG